MIVGVRSGMVLMLGLRRERLGRRRRCPRPVVRPVAFIGAIHLQGRISSTRPEESLPPSTHDDTKDSDIDMMATLVAGRIVDTLDFHTCFYLHSRSVSLLRSSFTSPSFRSQDFVQSIVVGIVGRIERTIFLHAEQPRCDVCASNAEKRLRENATLYKEKRECDEAHVRARA